MKFITQFILDKKVSAQRRLFNLYDWHGFIWKFFPDQSRIKDDSESKVFLHRIEHSEYKDKIIILSKIPPIRDESIPLQEWKIKEIPAKYFEYNTFLFKVYTNPTRSTKKNPDGTKREKKHGRHEAIFKPDELKTWIDNKAKDSGFHILDEPPLEISPPFSHYMAKNDDEGTIFGVEFKGALNVFDKDKFLKALRKGIGRARGFGFGMLVLQPIG